MTWQDIGGWFDFMDVYDEVVSRAPADRTSVFVEIGSWLGRSAAYMGQLIKESGKPITFFCVDCWEGSTCDGLDKTAQEYAAAGTPLYQRFLDNMEACGVSGFVTPIKRLSVDGAALFAPESCDFVLIDANHDEPAVRDDMRAWFPKVKPGGILAGHDYDRDSVRTPVHEFIDKSKIRVNRFGNTWVYDVPNCPREE